MSTILIVDDEKIHVDGLEYVLKQSGIELQVLKAYNGLEALEVLKSQTVPILLTDIKMPFMDGIDLCREAKTLNPNIKILIYTSYAEFTYAQQAIEIGVSSFILKPLKVPEFIESIQKVVRQCDEERLAASQKTAIDFLYSHAPAGETIHLLLNSHMFLVDYGANPDNNPASKEMDEFFHTHLDILMRVELFDSRSLYFCHNQNTPKVLREAVLQSAERDGLKMLVLYGNRVATAEQIRHTFQVFDEMGQVPFSLRKSELISIEEPGSLHKAGDLEKQVQKMATLLIRREQIKVVQNLKYLFSLNALQDQAALRELKRACLNIIRISTRDLQSEATDKIAFYVQQIYNSTSWQDLQLHIYSFVSNYPSLITPKNEKEADVADVVMAIVRKEYDSDISLDNIAERVYLSSSYLSYLFKKKTGKNLMRYINEVRLEKSKDLLRGTDKKISEISMDVGYSNVSYFTLLFRNHFGKTPTDYRENN